MDIAAVHIGHDRYADRADRLFDLQSVGAEPGEIATTSAPTPEEGLRDLGAATEPAVAGSLARAGAGGFVLVEGAGGEVVSLLDEHERVGEVEQLALIGRSRKDDDVDVRRRVPQLELESLVPGDRERPQRDVERRAQTAI